MICGIETGMDTVTRWGDPWHGLIDGATLFLPGGITRPVPGDVPVGGDCYAVQVPAQPAVTTSPADAAAGMTWLNYALMSGRNHCIYGEALGGDAWLYIDPDGAAWRCSLAFDTAARTGTVEFVRFGIFPGAGGGAVQTATFALPGPFTGVFWQIDDILSDGSGVLVVVGVPAEAWDWGGLITPGHRRLGGAFELVISGVPPAASVQANQLKSSSEASGSYIDTRVPAFAVVNNTTIMVANVGRFGHLDSLAGYCYSAGVPVPVLRSFWSDQEGYSSPADGGNFMIDYAISGEADHVYQLQIGSQMISLTGHTEWSGSGRVNAADQPPSHVSGHLTHTTTMHGHGGYSYTFDGDVPVSYNVNSSWIFMDSDNSDYYMPASANNSTAVAIWPKRLGNGLFGIARFERNFETNVFIATHLTGVVSPLGAESIQVSSLTASVDFAGTRHPITGEISVKAAAPSAPYCYR